MDTYQTVFITVPNLTEDEERTVVDDLAKVVTTGGGAFTANDRMGRRRLAYPIHAAAVRAYRQNPPSEEEYLHHVEQMGAYPGTEFWGAFHGDRMAAFATCQFVDRAVSLGSTKSDAELDKHNPNSALFYTIARHYLEQGLRYVSNGSRTLWHPTQINDFLETLGFRKVYCRVNVVVSSAARILDGVSISNWGRFLGLERLFGKRWMQLQGLHRLLRIAETFR